MLYEMLRLYSEVGCAEVFVPSYNGGLSAGIGVA